MTFRPSKVLAALALATLTTLTFAQNGTADHAGPPSHPMQRGSAPPRSLATRSPVTPAQHGAPRNTTYPHPGPQSQLHAPQAARSAGGTRIEHQLSSGRRILETTRATPGKGTLHAVRYGRAMTGVVEHPMKSGYLSRTYVQGGQVLYARVYRQNTFQRFGHSFSYESLVPAITFDTAYYAWAARPWGTPIAYRWQWDAEPWHAAFGQDFTPYQNYSSLDEWLTDYVIAQSLRNAYESSQAENAPESSPVAVQAPPAAGKRPYWEESSESNQRPYWDEPDDGRRPYWEEGASDQDAGAQPKSSKARTPVPNSRTGSQSRPPAEDSPPPIPGDIKAELNAQIKRQLVERQTRAKAADTEDLPDSLKPGHTLFRVSSPLDVASGTSGRYCSLKANDYIERTGDMDQNGMVPVKVKLGGIADCAIGLATSVSVNDLEAMESEQQQALTDALLAASKSMGGRGLPQAPATTPVRLAAGQTRPAPDAMSTLSQLQ